MKLGLALELAFIDEQEGRSVKDKSGNSLIRITNKVVKINIFTRQRMSEIIYLI